MYLECPECCSCFTLEELEDAANITLAVQGSLTGVINRVPGDLSEDKLYEFLLEEVYNIDCPECGEVICISDMCEI